MVIRPRSSLVATIVVAVIFPVSIFLSNGVTPSHGFIATTTTTLSQYCPLAKNKYDNRNNHFYSQAHTIGYYEYHQNAKAVTQTQTQTQTQLRAAQTDSQMSEAEILKAEAEVLKAKADKLRLEIEEDTKEKQKKQQLKGNSNNNNNVESSLDTDATTAVATNDVVATTALLSPWAVVSTGPKVEGDQDYRLYVDIGREDGTWMDPRWGASGKRIEFALDINLFFNRLAAPEMANKMIQDNNVGKSSQVFALETAQFARLRNGFDRMECKGGAYRIDVGKSGRRTIRMVVEVEGTIKADQSYIYGDVSIPVGCLYFSLPCFGSGLNNLSIKEGVASVRQVGWHTGWRREESRICGVFTAKSLLEAKRKDPY